MNACVHCQYFSPQPAPASAPTDLPAMGLCYGMPPRTMLMPTQTDPGMKLARPGPPQMQMTLVSVRSTVMAADQACSLFLSAVK